MIWSKRPFIMPRPKTRVKTVKDIINVKKRTKPTSAPRFVFGFAKNSANINPKRWKKKPIKIPKNTEPF